jgi:hypothetical protein
MIVTDTYNVLVETQHGINTQFIYTNINLIEQYKTAIIQGKGYIMWEDGVIDYTKIVGITRQPMLKPAEKPSK